MAKDTCGSAGVPRQFDRFCQMILKGEVMDYYRHLNYMQQNEIGLSALSEEERKQLYCEDEYEGRDYTVFQAMEYDICVKIHSLQKHWIPLPRPAGRWCCLRTIWI